MSAFTAPSNTNLFTRALWNELRNAYSERRQALAQSSVADYAVGGCGYTDVKTMQQWVESNCTSFVPHDETFDGAETWPSNYTWTTFKTAASLGSGWRRKTDPSGSYSYGQAQAGDVVGPWIVEDLQKAFAAMQWVNGPSISKDEGDVYDGEGSNSYDKDYGETPPELIEASLSQAKTDADDDYAYLFPSVGVGHLLASVRLFCSFYNEADWGTYLRTAIAAKVNSHCKLSIDSGFTATFNGTIELYVPAYAEEGCDGTSSKYDFYSVGGIFKEGAYSKVGDYALASGQHPQKDGGDVVPLVVTEITTASGLDWPSDPVEPTVEEGSSEGVWSQHRCLLRSWHRSLLKYSFTYDSV